MASARSIITAAELMEKVGTGPGAARLEAAMARAGIAQKVPSLLKTGAKTAAVVGGAGAVMTGAKMLANASGDNQKPTSAGSTLASNAARSGGSAGGSGNNTGSGALPSLKRASTPSVSPSMATNRLIITAINYLSSIDASLKNQVEMQRFAYTQDQNVKRENAFESKSGDIGSNIFDSKGPVMDNLGKGMGMFLLLALAPLLKTFDKIADKIEHPFGGKDDGSKRSVFDTLGTVAAGTILPAGLGYAAYKGYKASRGTPLDMKRSMYDLTEAEKANLSRQGIKGGGIHYTAEGSAKQLTKEQVFKAASKGDMLKSTTKVLKDSMKKGLKTSVGIGLALESLDYIFGGKKANMANLAESAGGLIGGVLGAALGTLLDPIIGPLGTIGGAIGGDMIGRKLGSSLANLFGLSKGNASNVSPSGGVTYKPHAGWGGAVTNPKAAGKDVYEDIRMAEGTSGADGYNMSLGYVDPRNAATSPDWTGPRKALSEMTMKESLEWGRYVRKNTKTGKATNSSAKGAFQIVDETQKQAMKELGFKDTDLFNETNQKKMADWIIKKQGLRPEVWQGFVKKPELLTHARKMYNEAPPPPDLAPKTAAPRNGVAATGRSAQAPVNVITQSAPQPQGNKNVPSPQRSGFDWLMYFNAVNAGASGG